jgi:DNA-binding response OmpR family regulator
MGAVDQLRREVMAQPAADRLSYALELLSFYLDPVPEFYQGCADLGLDLSARDMRILHALDRRRGKFVSADALQAAGFADHRPDDWGSIEAVFPRVAAIRRAFEASAYPVSIERLYGVGYRLIAPQDFKFERGAYHG